MSQITQRHRCLIWSPMPALRVSDRRTRQPSRQQKWKLQQGQVTQWHGFAQNVRNYTRRQDVLADSPPLHGLPSTGEKEHYLVANEPGVTGRIIQNVGQVVGQLCEILHLPDFADIIAGRGEPEGCSWEKSLPDFILLRDPGMTCLVAEVKVPWNTALDRLQADDFESIYGQIARYMDDCKCRYGVITTYYQTIFLRRNSNYTFQASDVLYRDDRSRPAPNLAVSVREAMLYMAYLAGNGERDAQYPMRVGESLIGRGGLLETMDGPDVRAG